MEEVEVIKYYYIGAILIVVYLDLLAIYRVIKDDTYLFDNDKPKYIFWIILIPIIGAIVAMRKIGYRGTLLWLLSMQWLNSRGGKWYKD